MTYCLCRVVQRSVCQCDVGFNFQYYTYHVETTGYFGMHMLNQQSFNNYAEMRASKCPIQMYNEINFLQQNFNQFHIHIFLGG